MLFRTHVRRALLVCLLPLCLVAGAQISINVPPPPLDPHHIDGSVLGHPIDLSSTWLMQPGDDPRFAAPGFDDSHWLIVQASRSAASYGLTNVDRVWYRTHVRILPSRQNLALLVRSFGGGFQVFVNGTEIGSSGPYPPGGASSTNYDIRFPVPAALIASGDLTIAFRASIGRLSYYGQRSGGIASYTTILLGPEPLLSSNTLLHQFQSLASNSFNLIIEILIPLMALALALTLPKEHEYTALVISGTTGVLIDSLNIWRIIHNSPPSDTNFLINGLLSAIAVISSLEFVRLVLGLRRSRWWSGYEALLAILLLGPVPLVNHALAFGAAGTHSTFGFIVLVIASIIQTPFALGLPLLALWVWWRQRNPDALLLFVPLFISAVVQYCQYILFLLNRFHLSDIARLPAVPGNVFQLQWSEVANFLFSMALLVFLVLRTVRIARSRAALESDLHAVQSVQEILLARASHATPGFRVEHVYHPASEVGGDFFLVSPGPDGSLTAIVGDVSGKGLVAAMRVSMILGVLRREEQREPESILRNLNEALLMQGEMGFTTACCVRMEKGGRYTIANAGHIAPYIGGEEVITPSSLPLGIEEGQQYEQVSGMLPAGKTLVMMSDGVVEARSAKGELYGFDRLRQLTMLSAHDIADVARRFGQEDDITVLTVSCGV